MSKTKKNTEPYAAPQLTQDEINTRVDEIASMPPRPKRIWEIDFARGLLILLVIMDHFFADVQLVGAGSKFTTEFWQDMYSLASQYRGGTSEFGKLRMMTHDTFVYIFVVLSGISCSFSRNNFKRALRMCVFAALFSAVTYAASSVFNQYLTTIFNIIHVVALSVLVYSGVELLFSFCKKNWQKNIFGAVMAAVTIALLVAGHYYRFNPVSELNYTVIFVNNVQRAKISPGDYWPLLPSLGWFFTGAFLGKALYREKVTLFPSVNAKWVKPVTFIGSYSIWFYFGSQVFMYGILYIFTAVLNVF